jgi:5-methylcytosine-specific restriction enzyme A
MTKLPDIGRLVAALTERFGVALRARVGSTDGGSYVDIGPSDLHPNDGFVVRTTIGWRNVVAELRMGSFASDLLRQMASSGLEQQKCFVTFADVMSADGGRVSLRINEVPMNIAGTNEWPSAWRSLNVSSELTPVMIDHENAEQIERLILRWGGNLLGMVMSLLPLENVELDTNQETKGFPEGAVERVIVNRYERSRINRALCTAVRGTQCAACGFDFGLVYGPLGEGFIFVHHITPVSRLGPGYIIDPVSDLVPLCGNCHSIVHRKDPPLSIEELKTLLGSSRASLSAEQGC